MRKYLLLVFMVAFAFAFALPTYADDMQLMRVTCYCPESCPGGVTASGTTPKANYTCGARRDLIGCVAMVYEDDNGKPGDFVGLYMIEDTGSAKRIKNGTSIDIYQNNIEDARAFVRTHGDYQWVQIIKGKG